MNRRQHNYIRKIDRMKAKGTLSPRVGLYCLHIRHTDECALLRGGLCDCDPHISALSKTSAGGLTIWVPPPETERTDVG